MAAKIEWTATDLAAKSRLAHIFASSGLSYRAIESSSDIGMSFARVRDIVQGRRAPVRLSEFLAICDVCHADPVQTLRQIIAEAARIQAEQDAREREDASEPDFLAMAAKRGDTAAEQEAYEEMP